MNDTSISINVNDLDSISYKLYDIYEKITTVKITPEVIQLTEDNDKVVISCSKDEEHLIDWSRLINVDKLYLINTIDNNIYTLKNVKTLVLNLCRMCSVYDYNIGDNIVENNGINLDVSDVNTILTYFRINDLERLIIKTNLYINIDLIANLYPNLINF